MDHLMVKIASDETLIYRCLLLVVKLAVSEKLDLDDLKMLPKNLKQSLMNIFSKRGYLTDRNIDVFLRESTTKVLELSECLLLTDVALGKIATTCKHLTKIDLNSHNIPKTLITSNGISNLARHCPHLHTVLLRRCVNVDNACVESISKHCLRLSVFNMANCPLVTDASLFALGQHCRHLKSINFTGTKVTDAGVLTLFAAPHVSQSIEEIHMAHCDELTDAAIECILLHCPCIKYLLFHACPLITDDSRIALEDYMATNRDQKIKHLSWTIY